MKQELENLEDDIRLTQVKLNQLVSGGQDIQLITPEFMNSIELGIMGTHTIKIDTKEHKGPL